MTARAERAVVEVRGATKRYGDVVALDDVSLQVHRGEVHALLGLNGAGKTTLIRMLLGMVRPSAGSISVLGSRVTGGRRGSGGRRRTAGAVWAEVGHLVETAAAYPELTVRENLEVVRRLRRLTDRGAVGEVIERLSLGPYADRRARSLSLGNAQRLGLAKALLHRPSLLVLDEPVNGLDPAGVVEVRDLLVGLARDHGVTVLLSSHLLGEVARTASRIAVLHEGRLVDELGTDAIGSRVRTHLEVCTDDNARAAEVLRRRGTGSRSQDGLLVVDDPAAVGSPGAVATCLVRADVPPTRLAVVREDLEAYFLRLVGVAAPAPPRRTDRQPEARPEARPGRPRASEVGRAR